MNATETFTAGRDLIELAGLFMVVLPLMAFGAIALSLYFKHKS